MRERGWAKAIREREDDVSAIAAPVFDARGDLVAILGVQGPASRFQGRTLTSALQPLLESTRSLSAKLG